VLYQLSYSRGKGAYFKAQGMGVNSVPA
jgi:hypothetical protein